MSGVRMMHFQKIDENSFKSTNTILALIKSTIAYKSESKYN